MGHHAGAEVLIAGLEIDIRVVVIHQMSDKGILRRQAVQLVTQMLFQLLVLVSERLVFQQLAAHARTVEIAQLIQPLSVIVIEHDACIQRFVAALGITGNDKVIPAVFFHNSVQIL